MSTPVFVTAAGEGKTGRSHIRKREIWFASVRSPGLFPLAAKGCERDFAHIPLVVAIEPEPQGAHTPPAGCRNPIPFRSMRELLRLLGGSSVAVRPQQP
jgi:hypothetical protein